MSFPGTNDPLSSQNTYQASAYGIGVYGQAVVNGGLCVQSQISGFGLLSDGLVWQYGEVWLDPASIDGIATSWTGVSTTTSTWTDSTTVGNPAYATGHAYYFRESVQHGGVTCPIGTVLVAANGQRFLSYLADRSLGSSGLCGWALSGSAATAGAVYRDIDNNLWTVSQNWSGIGQLQTYGATLTYNVFNTRPTVLTKVSGTGDAVFSNAYANADDFEITLNIQSELAGTQANVADNSISQFLVTPDPNLFLADSSVSGGDGTGWDASFGPEFI